MQQLITAMLPFLLGCGAATMPVADAADLALNAVTDTAQPSYEMVQDYCSQRQWKVIHSDRPVAQKEAAVSKIRARCHKVYDRFEDLIAAGWDLVIVDEAHRLAGSTEQVARHKLGRGLSAAAPYLLMLSATPH